jgi:hypothetical protein
LDKFSIIARNAFEENACCALVWPQQSRQLGDGGGDAPDLVAGEQERPLIFGQLFSA